MTASTPGPTAPTPDPDLLYSEDEDALRAAVRALLTARSDAPTVIAGLETDAPYDSALWRALATDIGAAGLLVPEKLGGQGASAREAAVVLEELGRFVTPVPYLTSGVLAVTALLGCDTAQEDVATLLGALAEGRTGGRPRTAAAHRPRRGARGDGAGRSGRCADRTRDLGRGRLGSRCPARPGTGPRRARPPRGRGRRRTAYAPNRSPPSTSPAASATSRSRALVGALLATGDRARAAVERAVLTGAGLLASEQLGVAEWCLDETVRYTAERTQFGRPVGSFQALKHRMAALWLEVASARAAARNAADALAGDSPDAAVAVAVAQAYCAPVAVRAAEECVQLHGGIGMTWEHPAHLFLKRAKSDEVALGTPGRHRDALAELAGLSAP